MDILGAFHFLRPQSAALPDYTMEVSQLQILAKRFCPDQEKVLLQEWFSFKNHVLTGPFQVRELNVTKTLSLSLTHTHSLSHSHTLSHTHSRTRDRRSS